MCRFLNIRVVSLVFALVMWMPLQAAEATGKVEVVTLTDGRVLTGIYDDEAQTLTLTGGMAAVLKIPLSQVAKRESAGAGNAGGGAKPTTGGSSSPLAGGTGGMTMVIGDKADPTVFDPVVADSVPWAHGDRVLIVGDLLIQKGQPELALRLHEALQAAHPDLQLEVFALQNHAISMEQWVGAAKAEIARQPPQVVLIMAGIGEVLAALPPPPAPGTRPDPNAPQPTISVPSQDSWRIQLTDLVTTAQKANAAVIVATPANVGDKPFGGLGSMELDSYAVAARAVAKEFKAELCDLRSVLIDRLTERNPKATREVGILSRTPGYLKAEGLDICAREMARSLAAAVPRIPWSMVIEDAVFTDSAKVTIRTPRAAVTDVEVHVTIDGSEPSISSPLYSGPLTITESTHVRAFAISKNRNVHQTTSAWILKPTKHVAERAPETSEPGLWVDHFPLPDWGTGRPVIDEATCDMATWWPNCELTPLQRLQPNQRPSAIACLRYQGYVVAPTTGNYVLALRSDGAARLMIGEEVVANITATATNREARAAVHLTEGFHRLTLYRGKGTAEPSLRLLMAEPGQRLRALPDLLLRRPTPRPGAEIPVLDTTARPEDPDQTWQIILPGGPFDGSTKVDVTTDGLAMERVDLYYTTDGSEPTNASDRVTRTISIGSTTRLRVLGVSKVDGSTVQADAWYTEISRHVADTLPSTSLPGLWVEHCSLTKWTDPISSVDKKRGNFTASWPTAELDAFRIVPVHRWPNHLYGLRFTGFFFAPVAGIYTFDITSDDAARITMGIVSVLKNDDLHPDRQQVESVELTAGWHALEIPYAQGPGITTLQVRVGLSGQRRQGLPDLVLRRSAQPPSSGGIVYDAGDDEEP